MWNESFVSAPQLKRDSLGGCILVMDDHALIGQIVGEQLSAVSFVQDYVEFHFDGPVIRSLAAPIVKDETGAIRFPNPGSRDKLCSLIGQTVSSFELLDGVELRLRLGTGELIVPLDARRTVGPEAMHFQNSVTAPVQVWTVG